VSFRSGWLPAAEKGFINLLLISSDAPDIDRNFGRRTPFWFAGRIFGRGKRACFLCRKTL
jgi:hypothetical protein